MRTHFDHTVRRKSQRLADLKNKTVQLERKLSDTRMSLERELAQFAYSRHPASGIDPEMHSWVLDDLSAESGDDIISAHHDGPPETRDRFSGLGGPARLAEERTEALFNHGRRSAYRQGLSGGSKAAIAVAVLTALVALTVVMLTGGQSSWPASVASVQREAATACRNPDVESEPGQVNFACAKSSRQILWVFALMTSHNNARFADARSGRAGLEPITPAQGGEVAWTLNLHHPYDPLNPIDSLEVAARAINNIVGGATVTGSNGKPVVQPGLESSPANCVRYTGSAALTSRKGFPKLCANRVTSQAGQAALVADIYQQWIVGASPKAAQQAALLFENATNPGDPRVRATLSQILGARPTG